MNRMRHAENDTLTFGWKEWSGMLALALAPAATLVGFFYNFSLGLESRLTRIEVNGANTVAAIQSMDTKTVTAIDKLDTKTDRIQALNSEINVLKTKLDMVEKRLEEVGDEQDDMRAEAKP